MTGEQITKAGYKAALREARQLLRGGNLAGARAMLKRMQADAGHAALGTPTALGLPRKLQAALLSLAKADGDAIGRIGYQYHLVPPPEIWSGLAAVTDAERAALAAAGRREVPRLIQQIWIGPLPPPAGTEAWRAYAEAQGYGYRLWREADLAAAGIDRHPVYAEMRAHRDLPGAVDVARYLILRDEGGIYLDCDWYPARPDLGFHQCLPLVGLTALAEDVPRLTGSGPILLNNSFIATPAGHPVFTRLLAVLPEVLRALPEAPAWWSTGPLLFTVIARAGPVSVAGPGLVAGEVAATVSADEVAAFCARAATQGAGLLLAWKPWGA